MRRMPFCVSCCRRIFLLCLDDFQPDTRIYHHGVTTQATPNRSNSAKAVAIDMSVEGGKTAASEGFSAAAKRTGVKALDQIAHSNQVIRSAEGQISKYSRVLAQEGLKKSRYVKAHSIVHSSRNVVARETGKIAQASKYASAAKMLGKAVPVVFAVVDILSAFSDYQDTMETTR